MKNRMIALRKCESGLSNTCRRSHFPPKGSHPVHRWPFVIFQVEKITDHQFLEALELRIAPASLLSFSDADGDFVKVRLTGGGTVTTESP